MKSRRLLCGIIAIFASITSFADFKTPDFAYPRTVVSDAESVLKTTDNGLTRLKAVMEIVKAKTEINPDSLRSMPAFVEKWSGGVSDRAVKSLFTLYRAQLMAMNRNSADSVAILTEEALRGVEEWGAQSSGDFAQVVSLPADWNVFFPKIRDFVFVKAVDLVPSKSSEYIDRAIRLSNEGSAEWIRWRCEQPMTYDELKSLYDKYKNGVTGAYIISRLYYQTGRDNTKELELAGILQSYLAENSENALSETLRSMLSRLKTPTMSVIVPEAVTPGVEFDAKIVHSYTSEVGVEIYKVSDIHGGRSVKTKIGTVMSDTHADAVEDTVKLKLAVEKPGNYEIYGVSKDIPTEGYVPRANVIATNWLPFGMVFEGNYVVAVSDFVSGRPVGGVTLTMSGNRGDKTKPLTGTSDTDGLIFIDGNKKDLSKGGLFTLSRGNEKVQFNEGLWSNSWNPSWSSVQGAIFVERPLYHPGDTLGWSAVITEKNYEKLSSKLIVNRKFSVILYDANYQPTDTIEAVSDEFGRIYGKFAIPSDRLAGRYRISVVDGHNYVCDANVTVSDFKMPVFEVVNLKVERNDTAYLVSGRAVRYSGAAVPDARVAVSLRQAPLWWAWNDRIGSAELMAEGTTLADGAFTVSVPADAIIPPDGLNFICEATVTSLNADVASASMQFRVGKAVMLGGNGPGNEVDGASPVKIGLRSIGTDLKFVPVDLTWTLSSGKQAVYSGECRTDSTGVILDWSRVKAGKYGLKFVAVDTTMCNSLELGDLWVYNTVTGEMPSELRLVVPQTEYADVSGDAVDVFFGVGSEAYVYTFGTGKDGNIEAGVKKYAPGFHTVRIDIDGRDRQSVKLVTVADGQTFVSDIRVRRALPDNSLVLRGESWRDKLIPGGAERWTLRLGGKNGRGAEGALIATMYNDALNALTKNYRWPDLSSILSAPQKTVNQQFSYTNFTWEQFSLSEYRPVKNFRTVSPQYLYLPEFMTVENAMLLKKSRATSAKLTSDAAVVEDAVEEEATAGASPDPSPEEDFEYRDAETLQALWMPALSTDKDGYAVIEFTMPNAVGTWDFYASAWTKNMQCASLAATLVSSKPVMVEPALPRFLRQGDVARVGATVINNTDSAARIITDIEIFNPTDNTVLKTEKFENWLEGKGQALVFIEIEGVVDIDAIGYRVRSSNGEFTDGEQAAVPVLEAATIAIDSDIFYLNENQTTFTTTIPADSSGNGIVAIEYCQNPVWDAVKTLPGLYETEPRTAIAAASSAYAALTAKYLYRKFPEISRVLSIWNANPSDSSLVSDLEKNQDIKLAVLAQTPFVGAANANTQRMERLALTFNSKIIERVLSEAVAKLTSLQRASGGFSWGAWASEASVWVTMQVLTDLSRVYDIALVNENRQLSNIVDKAFTFLDRSLNLNGANRGYALLYSRFPGRKPSTQSGVVSIDATVQQILKDWKNHSTAMKADDALILNAFGSTTSAKEIMRSISQFAQNSPRRGVVFPSVQSVDNYVSVIDAYAKLEPESSLLDGMRKWLILSTQTTDNLGAWNPSALVAAILSSGSCWTADPSSTTANVSVDGRPLKINNIEAATGAFSQRLSPSKSQRAVTFTYPGGSPGAYGSVTTVSTVPLAQVSPRSVEDLSVRKSMKAMRNGKWVETDEFILGERVKVELVVEVGSAMEYIMVTDRRPAGFEPVEQMPGWVSLGMVYGYREVTDTSINLFVDNMRKGVYTLSYEATAAYSGTFVSGIASVQSQYAPEMTARSGAEIIKIHP